MIHFWLSALFNHILVKPWSCINGSIPILMQVVMLILRTLSGKPWCFITILVPVMQEYSKIWFDII